MNKKMYTFIFAIGVGLHTAGCSETTSESTENLATEEVIEQSVGIHQDKSDSRYLAYEHNLSVDLPKENIQKIYEKVLSTCNNNEKYRCIVLNTHFNAGEYISAKIKLRIKPEGVNHIKGVAVQLGKISNQSTDVKDLGVAIIDTEKRLAMLKNYQLRLQNLENNFEDSLDSLIKLASELSEVQSKLEFAKGEKSKLLQRVNMDIVNISLFSREYISFWQPILDALGDFGKNLSEGISQAITAMAYILPWLGMMLFLLFGIRAIVRKGRKKRSRYKV